MKLICVLLTVFVLGVTPAYADETKYFPQVIPACTLVKAADKSMVCAYTIDEWKEVLKVDAEVVSLRINLKHEQYKNVLLHQQKTSLHIQLNAFADSQKVMSDRILKVTDKLIAKDKKYQNERVKPRLGSPAAWMITAISVSLATGFIVKEALSD